MEDIIFFLIVAISIVASVVSNYNKEAKKNAKRVVGQPASKPVTTTASQQKIKTLTSQKRRPTKPILSLDEFQAEGERALKPSDYINDIDELKEFDYNEEARNNDISNDKSAALSERIIESKDDFKRAIIYSTILERKF